MENIRSWAWQDQSQAPRCFMLRLNLEIDHVFGWGFKEPIWFGANLYVLWVAGVWLHALLSGWQGSPSSVKHARFYLKTFPIRIGTFELQGALSVSHGQIFFWLCWVFAAWAVVQETCRRASNLGKILPFVLTLPQRSPKYFCPLYPQFVSYPCAGSTPQAVASSHGPVGPAGKAVARAIAKGDLWCKVCYTLSWYISILCLDIFFGLFLGCCKSNPHQHLMLPC